MKPEMLGICLKSKRRSANGEYGIEIILTTAAMFFGLVMNFSYLFAGTISTNLMDILIGIIIIAAGYNAGRIGLDRWVIPFIRKTIFKERNTLKNNAA